MDEIVGIMDEIVGPEDSVVLSCSKFEHISDLKAVSFFLK